MSDTIQQIPLEQLHPSEGNRRVGGFDQTKLEQLAESIKAVGVQQPAVVRECSFPGVKAAHVEYELVAGERRWRAAKLAGLEALPCVVRELDDVTVLKIQTIENLQREDIHPLDEADGYARLIERAGYDVAKLAGEIGKSASYVYQRLKLRDLVDDARTMLADGKIAAGQAILIARLPETQQRALLKSWMFSRHEDAPSVRELDEVIHRDFLLDLAGATFRKDDADLVLKAGPCTNCPKRTGFQPELFADVCNGKKRDFCTDPPCFNRKLDAHLARQREALEGKDIVKVHSPNIYSGGSKEKGVLNHWETENAKRSEPGAKLALIVDGPDRGKTKYVKPRGTAEPYRASPEEKARRKREGLEWAIERELPNRLVKAIATLEVARIKDCGIPADRLELLLEGVRAENYAAEDLLELNGWGDPDPKTNESPAIADLHLTPYQLLLGLFQVALLGLKLGSQYGAPKDNRLLALAKEHGLDVKELKAEIRAELKAKEKAPKKSKVSEASEAEPEEEDA